MCIQKLSINLWNQLCNEDRNMHSAITDEKNNGAIPNTQGPFISTPCFNGACQQNSNHGFTQLNNAQRFPQHKSQFNHQHNNKFANSIINRLFVFTDIKVKRLKLLNEELQNE